MLASKLPWQMSTILDIRDATEQAVFEIEQYFISIGSLNGAVHSYTTVEHHQDSGLTRVLVAFNAPETLLGGLPS